MALQLKTKQTDAAASGAAKRPATRGRVPTKQNINLAMVGVKRTRWWLVFVVLIAILLVAAVVAKFLVLDRLAMVSAAQAEAEAVRAQIDAYNSKIEDYGELNDLYAHYTYSGMSEEERTRVQRVEVMDLMQRTVLQRTDVSHWELKGNQLTMTVEGNTLEDINATAQKLGDDPMVSYCQVNTAVSDFTPKQAAPTENTEEPEQEIVQEKVAATIVAYLATPEEEAKK